MKGFYLTTGLLITQFITVAQMPGVAWGDNSAGQLDIFAGLSNVVSIAAGGYHSLALLDSGRVVDKGTYLTASAQTPAGLPAIAQIAAGFSHSVALGRDGGVYAWGDNSFGQTNVPPGLSVGLKIAAGGFHTLFLDRSGSVVVWGDNSHSQSRVPAGVTDVIDVAGGAYHSLALLKNRRVVAWGDDSSGQTDVPPDLNEVVAIAAGALHNLALKGDGTVVGWGKQSPAPAGFSNVVAIAAGDGFSLALKNDGTVLGWGDPFAGQENGLSNVVAIAAGEAHALALVGSPSWPAILEQPLSTITQLHSALTLRVRAEAAGPIAYQWWFNRNALLGATNGTLTIDDFTADRVGTYSAFVSAGGFTIESAPATIALPQLVVVQSSGDQTIRAGDNARVSVTVFGAAPTTYQWYLNGTALPNATAPILSLPNFASTNAGVYTLVATNPFGSITNSPIHLDIAFPPLITSGPVDQTIILGENAHFEVAAAGSQPLHFQWRVNGTIIARATTASLDLLRPDVDRAGLYCVMVSNAFGSVTSGSANLEVRVPNRAVRAWGTNIFGETIVPPALSNIISVAAGDNMSFAIKDDGTVVAWGLNSTNEARPPAGLSHVVQLAPTTSEILALKSDGTVVAWGHGPGTNVPPGLSNVISIAAGSLNGAAVRADGSVATWGSYNGSLSSLSNLSAVAAGGFDFIALTRDGHVVAVDNAVPPPDELANVVAIAAGAVHYLALRDDGTVVSWGGQTNVPPEATNVVAISAHGSHSLAVRRDGTLLAWGESRNGEGTVPTLVSSNIVGIAAGQSHNLAIIGTPAWPAITAQPLSIVTNDAAAVRFEVFATSSAALSYEWQHDGVNLPGATNAFLELTRTTPSDAGDYRVLITADHQTVHSRRATLNFSTPFVSQFPQAQGILEEQSLTLTPRVFGAPPLKFQWYFEGAPVAGATNLSLTLTNLEVSQGGRYELHVENAYTNIVSPTLPLTVWKRPRVVDNGEERTFDFRRLVLHEGDDLQFSADVTGTPPLTLTWRSPTGVLLSSNVTVTLTNVQFSQSGDYHLTVSSPYVDAARAFPATLDLDLAVLLPPGRVAVWGKAAETSVPVPDRLTNVAALAAGYRHNLALTTDGTVIGWGDNASGQLGIVGLSNVVQIAAAGNYSLALLKDGTVTGSGKSSWPLPLVATSATNILQLSAGTNHVLALRRDGAVFGWGRNNSGQLNVPLTLSNVIAIAAGGSHSLALKRDGTVVAWGNNLFRQAQVPAGLSNVIAIAAGGQHSLALLSSGVVQGWGDNTNWQVTDTSTADPTVLLRLGVTNIIEIGAGLDFSVALRNDGHVFAWGAENRFLDQITTAPLGLLNAVQIAAGPSHTIALTGIPLADRPMLNVNKTADSVLLSWPIFATNWILEATEDLNSSFEKLEPTPRTLPLTNAIQATIPLSGPRLFFRLKHQP